MTQTTPDTTAPVMEIVSFRLNPGVEAEDFRNAASAVDSLLRARGTASARRLVVDDDGLWTDIIEWASMAEAKSAAEDLVQDPLFAPFGAMIDPSTVNLRHAPVQHRME